MYRSCRLCRAARDRPLKPQLIGCSFLGTTHPSAWFLLTTHRAHSLGLQDGSCCGQGAEGSRKWVLLKFGTLVSHYLELLQSERPPLTMKLVACPTKVHLSSTPLFTVCLWERKPWCLHFPISPSLRKEQVGRTSISWPKPWPHRLSANTWPTVVS